MAASLSQLVPISKATQMERTKVSSG